MSWWEALAFWFSTFGYVLAAGFQSRNVNAGRYISAIFGTLGICTMQLITVRTISSAEPMMVWLVSVLGAVPGITLAIYLSQRFYPRKVT